MVTVSFAANFRGSAGSAASLAAPRFASANLASFVIPSEARNLLFAASPPEPSQAAAPIPLAACRINSLRFMIPPLFSSDPSPYRLWTPQAPGGYHPCIIRPLRSPPRMRHTAPPLPFRPTPHTRHSNLVAIAKHFSDGALTSAEISENVHSKALYVRPWQQHAHSHQSRQVRDPRRIGPRRHGRRLPRQRPADRPHRRRQDHPALRRGHRNVPRPVSRALPNRSARCRAAHPPQHRGHLRRRR